MSKSYTFSDRKKQENIWIKKVFAFLDKNNLKYEDVSENSSYYKDDIDVIILGKDKNIMIEIKVDDIIWKTENFFLETVSNKAKDTEWCFLSSKADIWFYIDTKKQIFYAFPLDKTRNWFIEIKEKMWKEWRLDEYKEVFREKETYTKKEDDSYSHTTVWSIVNKLHLLWWLKMTKIPFLALWFNDSISIDELYSLYK